MKSFVKNDQLRDAINEALLERIESRLRKKYNCLVSCEDCPKCKRFEEEEGSSKTKSEVPT